MRSGYVIEFCFTNIIFLICTVVISPQNILESLIDCFLQDCLDLLKMKSNPQMSNTKGLVEHNMTYTPGWNMMQPLK